MVSELDFVNAKPRRVLAYLKILAKTAAKLDPEDELKLTPSKEDLVLARERAFREKVEQNIDEIETRITKTLYHLHSKLNKAKGIVERQKSRPSKGRLKAVNKINVVSDNWVSRNTVRLAEMHKIKQKLRLLEEKSLWLNNKGYDSKKLRQLELRIDKAKEMLYLKLGSILDSVAKDKLMKKEDKVETLLEKNVIGNTANGKYHRLNCRSAKAMSRDNRSVLESANAAKKKGYKPCKLCFPKD